MTDNKLVEALTNSIVKLQFKKKDGSIRDMRATLMSSHVEPLLKPVDPNKPERKKNPNIQCVVDVDKGEFRSFTWESLIKWEVEK